MKRTRRTSEWQTRQHDLENRRLREVINERTNEIDNPKAESADFRTKLEKRSAEEKRLRKIEKDCRRLKDELGDAKIRLRKSEANCVRKDLQIKRFRTKLQSASSSKAALNRMQKEKTHLENTVINARVRNLQLKHQLNDLRQAHYDLLSNHSRQKDRNVHEANRLLAKKEKIFQDDFHQLEVEHSNKELSKVNVLQGTAPTGHFFQAASSKKRKLGRLDEERSMEEHEIKRRRSTRIIRQPKRFGRQIGCSAINSSLEDDDDSDYPETPLYKRVHKIMNKGTIHKKCSVNGGNCCACKRKNCKSCSCAKNSRRCSDRCGCSPMRCTNRRLSPDHVTTRATIPVDRRRVKSSASWPRSVNQSSPKSSPSWSSASPVDDSVLVNEADVDERLQSMLSRRPSSSTTTATSSWIAASHNFGLDQDDMPFTLPMKANKNGVPISPKAPPPLTSLAQENTSSRYATTASIERTKNSYQNVATMGKNRHFRFPSVGARIKDQLVDRPPVPLTYCAAALPARPAAVAANSGDDVISIGAEKSPKRPYSQRTNQRHDHNRRCQEHDCSRERKVQEIVVGPNVV